MSAWFPTKEMNRLQEKESRSRPLYSMFNAIPRRYDLINRLMTLGQDRRWRDLAARECLGAGPRRVLDLGCGTGDLAINIVRRATIYVNVTGFDYSPAMLEVAARKAEMVLGRGRITFVQGEAASLPFPEAHFDSVGISFAFRNLTYKNRFTELHLAEIFRILSPGGRLVVVESSQPRSRVVRWLFHLYLKTCVYWLGWWLSGNKVAYKYLSESAMRFYTPEEVGRMLRNAGFREVTYRPLLLGAAGIHVAIK